MIYEQTFLVDSIKIGMTSENSNVGVIRRKMEKVEKTRKLQSISSYVADKLVQLENQLQFPNVLFPI